MATSSEDGNRYSLKHLRTAEAVGDIGRDTTSVYHTFGYDIAKRGNISFIEEDVIVYTASNFVIFENILSGTRQYLRGVEDCGVGCVTVHPSKTIFAVGGVGFRPKIFIYTYPNMEIIKTLSGGAERGFATLAFNSVGTKLASVATSPDYMLTLWDWQDEAIGLHSKAFGQDVCTLRFSLDNELKLTTSGSGHIRFWKMASTFTGLKLQGSIGKFGKVELSDIYAFVELPDGKVLSGTDTGALLLWEGNFVKCRFVLATGGNCHDGEITYVEYDRKQNLFVTAGADGYMKWWQFGSIDTAEVDSDVTMNFDIMPLGEFSIGRGRGIKTITARDIVGDGDSITYVIQDTCGAVSTLIFALHGLPVIEVVQSINDQILREHVKMLESGETEGAINPWTYKSSNYAIRTIDSGNYSPVIAVDCCPTSHLAVTCNNDGIIGVYDYINRREVARRKFEQTCTCLTWVPLSVDGTGMSFVVGFTDGVVRVLTLSIATNNAIHIKLVMVIKPHLLPITDISFSSSGSYLATAARDGNVFILNCRYLENEKWTPIRFFSLAKATNSSGKLAVYCEKLSWSTDDSDNFILCSCSDKKMREADVSSLTSAIDLPLECDTYEYPVPIKQITITATSEDKVDSGDKSSATAPNSPSKQLSSPRKKEKEVEKEVITYDSGVSVYSKLRSAKGIIVSASRFIPGPTGGDRKFLFEGSRVMNSDKSGLFGLSATDVAIGCYSSDGKDSLRVPNINMMKYSSSGRFLIICQSDGVITLKPVKYFDTFVRAAAHNFLVHGVQSAALSFDDRFLISAGNDGVVGITRVAVDRILSASTDALAKDIEAGVFDQPTKVISPKQLNDLVEPSYLHLSVFRNFESSPIENFPEDEESSKISPSVDNSVIFYNNKPHAADVADITNVNAYSLEDEKLKAGEDSKKSAADVFKDRLKVQIKSMRKEYLELMRENNHLPPTVKLSREAMSVEGDYWNTIKAEADAQIDEVHKECEYEYEKSMVLRQKVTNTFMSGLLMEEIIVSSFPITGENNKNIPSISTLRTKGIDVGVNKILSTVKQIMKKERETKTTAAIGEAIAADSMSKLKDKTDRKKKEEDSKKIGGVANTGSPIGGGDKENLENGVEKTRPLTSSHARREARKLRKIELADHDKLKPKENEDDARDIHAIISAEKYMGDYKIKSSLDDYVITEEQRTNANQKRQQMAMLENTMAQMRLIFNDKVLNLRVLKGKIIETVRKDNERIRDIDIELQNVDTDSSSSQALNFQVDPKEYPDDRHLVTESELASFASMRGAKSWEKCPVPMNTLVEGKSSAVSKHPISRTFITLQPEPVSLKSIKEESIYSVLSSSVIKAAPNPYNDPSSSSSSLSSSSDNKENFMLNNNKDQISKKKYYEVDDSVIKISGSSSFVSSDASRARVLECIVPCLRAVRFNKEHRLQSYVKTVDPVAQQKCAAKRKDLELEKSMKLKNIDKTFRSFNEAIIELRVQRQMLQADLKLAELKIITLFREYCLLLTFEGKDMAIQQKQVRCQAEKAEIISNSNDTKLRLDSRIEELKISQTRAAQCILDFNTLIPESHVFYGPLLKIFKKKIKKNSNNNNNNGDDDDDEDDDFDDDDDDDDEVEDICPNGCASELYENVCNIRAAQSEANYNCLEIQKSIDDLKKALDRLKSREKQIVKDAIATDYEFNQFQLQKQEALNRIDVLVPVSLSQIYCFSDSGSVTFPTDRSRPIDGAKTEENAHLFDSANRIRDRSKRGIVPHIDMNNYVFISKRAINRLDDRIGELHIEVDEAVTNFKELHHTRSQLKKQRINLQTDIETRSKKVEDLQMLKFGRMIDLDELESGADKSKEIEAEAAIKALELETAKSQFLLSKEVDKIQAELVKITSENTKLLDSVGSLTQQKMALDDALNSSISGSTGMDVGESQKEKEERERILTYIKLQAREIETLRAEIYMLKRKDAPPIQVPSMPMPVGAGGTTNSSILRQQDNMNDSFLPPLPRGSSR